MGLGRGAAGAQLLPLHPPHSRPAELAPRLAQPDCVGHGDSGWLEPGDALQNSPAVETPAHPSFPPSPPGRQAYKGVRRGALRPLLPHGGCPGAPCTFLQPLLCIYRYEPELTRGGGGESFRELKQTRDVCLQQRRSSGQRLDPEGGPPP